MRLVTVRFRKDGCASNVLNTQCSYIFIIRFQKRNLETSEKIGKYN